MSEKEINRYKVINDVLEHRISQIDAACILGMSSRQVRRLLVRFKEQGAAGLVHRSHGIHPAF